MIASATMRTGRRHLKYSRRTNWPGMNQGISPSTIAFARMPNRPFGIPGRVASSLKFTQVRGSLGRGGRSSLGGVIPPIIRRTGATCKGSAELPPAVVA